MIRVAAGEKLPLAQADVKRNGWAIECRINAEDPFRNFLPSTGRLVRFQPPKESMWSADTEHLQGVRVDTGVQDGGEIPMYYDSMIAKLIVHGQDRNEAIAKMREALNGFVIRGISSNIPFQAALLAHPKFVAGDFNTGFIAENYGKGFHAEDVPHEDADFLVALAAYVNRRTLQRAAGISGQLPGHEFTVGEDFVAVLLDAAGQHRRQPATVRDFQAQSGSSVVEVGGQALRDLQQLAHGRRAHSRHRQRQGLHGAGGAGRGQEPAGHPHHPQRHPAGRHGADARERRTCMPSCLSRRRPT